MKRRCLPLIALLILAAAALLLAACAPLRENFLPTADELSSEVIRIHIRANGNGEADQRVKLAVRDALTEKLSVILADCTTKSEAKELSPPPKTSSRRSRIPHLKAAVLTIKPG